MKQFILLLILFTSSVLSSQIVAITQNGDTVLLSNDSTWTFISKKIRDSVGTDNSAKVQDNEIEKGTAWSTRYYVDDFGDKTDTKYQSYTDDEGQFTNSATSGSSLTTRVLIDDDNIIFQLYEYGRGSSEGKAIGTASYSLSLKSNSKIYKYSLKGYEKFFVLKDRDRVEFLSVLRNANDNIKCYFAVTSEYSEATYNFKLEPLK